MVDIRSDPLLLRLRPTFPDLCSHGRLSSYGPIPFPSALLLISPPVEWDGTLNQWGTALGWAGSLNHLTVMHRQWAGGRAAAPAAGLRLSGATHALLGSTRARHAETRLQAYSAALTENKLHVPLQWALSFLCHRGHSTKRGPRKLFEIEYPRSRYFVVLSFTRYIFLPPVSSTVFVFLSWRFWLVDPNE